MPVDYQRIYASQARAYRRLVSAEDCDDNLRNRLVELLRPSGRKVLEVGAGTGRVTRWLAEAGACVVATEPAQDMLRQARVWLGPYVDQTVCLVQADVRSLPVAAGWADVALAGWVLGHFRSWYAGQWQREIGDALARMEECLTPAGNLVIIETLGTGETTPRAPTEGLRRYYRWLEEDLGFQHEWLRTDYQFADVDEAADVCRRFFGDEFADRVRAERWVRVPECTGLWWRRRTGLKA